MRSARTDRLNRAGSRDVVTSNQPTHHDVFTRQQMRRAMCYIVGFCLAALIITGCSEGDARDARRAQSRDATQESIISDLQATHNAARFSGTPTPDATRAPDDPGDINIAPDDTPDDPNPDDDDDDGEQPRIVPVGGGS